MDILNEYGGQLLAAFVLTLELTALSALGSLLLGTVLTAMRVSPVWALRTVATGYVNLVRNTPLTLVVLFASFGLAQQLGITLADPESPTSITDSSFRLAVLAFSLYTATFVSEALRAGVNAVPSASRRRLVLWVSDSWRASSTSSFRKPSVPSSPVGKHPYRTDQEHDGSLRYWCCGSLAAYEGNDRKHVCPDHRWTDLWSRLHVPDHSDRSGFRIPE